MKSILIKLSGELFKKPSSDVNAPENVCMDVTFVRDIVIQIKQLTRTHRVSIVIGGGNFFRGSKEGRNLGLRQTTADAVGMLATAMNGLILQDFMRTEGVPCTVLGTLTLGTVKPIDQSSIDQALEQNHVIIFTGGTGNPYFSTDTAAVLRALQVGSSTVWKATTVDHLYDQDPAHNKDARPIKTTTYQDVLVRKLKVMDLTAITLAQEYNITLRIFSIYEPNALGLVAADDSFGSTISS